MGQVDWWAVVLAAVAAAAWGVAWYVWLFRGQAAPRARHMAAMLVPAWLMGHNFARLGAGVLLAKPWLYWMMSGGFAPAMVWPALLIAHGRQGASPREGWIDAGYFLTAFLIMGTVFRVV